MKLSGDIYSKEYWEMYAATANKELFGDMYPDEVYKDYDFVVLVTNEDKDKVCYSTVKELDKETVYLNFGGTFSKFRGKGLTNECFNKIVSCLKDKYKRLGLTCRTKNIPMIKVGLNEGFEIVGMRMVYGFVNLELLYEKENN